MPIFVADIIKNIHFLNLQIMESLNNVVVNDSTESSDLLSYSMVTDAGFVFFDLKKGIHEEYLKITQSKSMDDAFEYHRERIFLQKSELVQFRSELNRAIEFWGEDGLLENHKEKLSYIERLKRLYKNAFKSWDMVSDDHLRYMYLEGKSIEELMAIFGRSKKAIEKRIKKVCGKEILNKNAEQ